MIELALRLSAFGHEIPLFIEVDNLAQQGNLSITKNVIEGELSLAEGSTLAVIEEENKKEKTRESI